MNYFANTNNEAKNIEKKDVEIEEKNNDRPIEQNMNITVDKIVEIFIDGTEFVKEKGVNI